MLENLKIACLRRKSRTGETQGEIGMKAGIVESRLSSIINERMLATPEERISLSSVLGISEDILFAHEEQGELKECFENCQVQTVGA